MAFNINTDIFSEQACVICRQLFADGDDVSCVTRGLDTLMEFAEVHHDSELLQYLSSRPAVVKVHNSCRREFCSRRRLQQKLSKEVNTDISSSKSLRSSTPAYDWKSCCLFCSKSCITSMQRSNRDVRHVETLEIRDHILNMCVQRQDQWGTEVQARMLSCIDLVAAEAVYHKNCHSNFFRTNLHASSGRPADSMKAETFDRLCEWLEVNDWELLTLEDIVDRARQLVPNNESTYSAHRMKQKLLERYKDHIQFNEVCGRRNVVCWKEMASYIVNEKWHQQQKGKDLAENIVITAAKLLKTVIRDRSYNTDCYPKCADVQDPDTASSWMPDLLKLFMDHLICPSIKKVSIGQAIVQAVKPRLAIMPLPFSLGISVDHITGSKYLIDLLYRLGFSVSYDEIYRFKQSVVRCESADSPQQFPEAFTQFVADNVDHDVCTLDGYGTLHGMGIISITSICSTPSPSYDISTSNPNANIDSNEDNIHCNITEKPIPRLKLLKSTDIAKLSRVPLLHCSLPTEPMSSIKFLSTFHSYTPTVLPQSLNIDLVFHLGYFCQKNSPRPSWGGFNDLLYRSTPAKASDIRMQPIIDLNPNDVSCIYSTLVYIDKQAKTLNVGTPVVTFDQPLWLKSVGIINYLNLNIVCRLGAFHTLMSFLGSIGNLMSGSGLEEIIGCCYGPNTVKHIISGKAVSRAVRAHYLIESALNVLLTKSLLSSGNYESEMNIVEQYYVHLMAVGFNEETEFPPAFSLIEQGLNELKLTLAGKSRTAKLFILYMDCVSNVKMLIRAERTADWQLHLVSIRQMVPIFAATGHNNYAKCARLYLEIMSNLQNSHPDVFQQFMCGSHVARRSDKFWCGISTDLTIEQGMMKELKGRGGLTHGRGVTDTVRATWVATVHKTAAFKTALSQLTTSELSHDAALHPELGKSRIQRDNEDLQKILEFIEFHNPFDITDLRLRCITSGTVAAESDDINCDNAEEVGANILTYMNDSPFTCVKLKRRYQVKSLAQVTTVNNACGKRSPNLDPTILFHRLLIIGQRTPNMKSYFSFELSAYPTSLFIDGCMRKVVKSQLANEISKNVDISSDINLPCGVPVIDGGYLLHVVHWPDNASYADVVLQYISYVKKHFGKTAIVIFDGYGNGPSTKDHEHLRRSRKMSPDIAVDLHKTAYSDSAAFFGNSSNKGAFVELLISSFKHENFTVNQAEDDADTLIVKTAIDLAAEGSSVNVIANDTDVLVLLIAHFNIDMSDILMFTKADRNVYNIRQIVASLGQTAVQRLLTIHALSGCDTTSGIYGHGKVSVFKKFVKARDAQPLFDVLESPLASHDEVMLSGCRLLSLLYSGSLNNQLNDLRYTMYMHMTATSSQLPKPERLPPTENAARFHIYRAHLQIIQWKQLKTKGLKPTEWGWTLHEGKYIPFATDIDIAPPDILKVSCCKCSADTRRPCGTQACLCRKYGLYCVSACKNCNGSSCENASVIPNTDDIDDDNDEPSELMEAGMNLFDEDIIVDDDLDYEVPWVVEEVVS